MLFNTHEITSCIVVETISKKDSETIERLLNRLTFNIAGSRIFNKKYLTKCPINSVIVKIQNPSTYMVLYPFFSSHISLPVKPGEHVWAFFPSGVGKNDIGYWMSRRATDYFIEDPNFTHNARSSYRVYNNSLITKDKENDKGVYYSVKGNGVADYESLLINTEGNSSHVFESIQRTYKKPSDLLLQGSNNTQLVFTNGNEKETGTIIMSAGRGKTDATALEKISSNIGLEESNKASKLSKIGKDNENEGNLDVLNDKAILLLSENPFYINESLPEEAEDHQKFSEEMSCFFAKADQIRMEARDSIFMNTEYFDVQSEKIVLGSGEQPYIKYDEFKTLIEAIIDDLDGLRQQINTFCTTQTAAISAAGGAPGGYVGLSSGYATLTGQTVTPYSPDLKSKVSPVQSQKIFGE